MFGAVTAAEGGGWGVKVSTAVGVMWGSSMSQHSLSWTIGAAKTLHSKKIRDTVDMKLTSSAKTLLS